jgi:phage terminase large subunit-like protein
MNKIKRVEKDFIKSTKLNIFIVSDYAYSKHIYSDESAIITFGIDDESNYYVLYSDKGKWGDIGTTERIIDQVRIHHENLKLVGVEARGLGFIERSMMEVKREENFSFGVVELKPENRSKPERIKAMISVVEDGRVYFVGPHRKLEGELICFRGEELRHGDDLSDTFAYMRTIAFKPATQKTREQKEKEEQARAFKEFADDFRRSKEQQSQSRRVIDVHQDRYY